MSDSKVRVRFCPSPTGNPHVGLARTALYNWVFARHHGGDLVFRIEDTDAARDSEESYQLLLDTMRWLGFDWDEGPEVGGPYGPYRQSERHDIYLDVLARLRGGGLHLRLLLHQRRGRRAPQGAGSKLQGYDGFCRELTDEQVAAFRAEDRQPVSRFRMPDGELTWDDLVRGDITFQTEHVPDFAVARANGQPLYTLVNPVDDAMMHITHVLRGEDLLSSTPRQLALYTALTELGIAEARRGSATCRYVMGEGNKKLSKRDPQGNLLNYREAGFLPEGLLNYLALLGWAISGGPRHLLDRGDGRGVRDRRREPQPGALRHEEGRGHQRRAHAAAVGRGDRAPLGPVPRRRRPRRRPADRRAAAASWTPRCRWSPSGSTSSPSPSRCWASCSSTRRTSRVVDEIDDGPRRREGGVRRPRRARRTGPRPRSRTPCVSRSSRAWSSSRATPSGRSASPSPAARCRRRCSSRSSSSVGTGASRGCPRPWRNRGPARRPAGVRASPRAAVPPDPHGRPSRLVAVRRRPPAGAGRPGDRRYRS